MKKLILFLLFPLWAAAQTANGTETKANAFRALNPQTVTSPTFLTTTGTDGTQGKSSNVVNQINSSNNSGILSFDGLAVNTDPTKYDIGAGVGYIMNSITGVSTKVTWTAQTAQTTPYLLTSIATYVLKDNAGLTVLQNSAPTPQQYRTHIYLGKLAHTTFTTILFAVTEPSRMFDTTGQVSDINKFLGSGNIEGNVISYNGSNLNINASAGMTYRPGANFMSDRNSPSITTETSFTAGTFRNKFRNGSGGWSAVNTTTIDPNYYDDGTGILAVVPNNKWTIKVFWRFGGTGTIHCDYGQTVYDSKAQALEAVGKAVTAEDPETKRDASKRGWLVVKQGITVLNDITTAEFLQADKFGERAAGGSSTATMQTAYNNSVTPQITTSTGLGAVAFKRGSAADTDNVLVVQNGAGSDTFTVKGNGDSTGRNIIMQQVVSPVFSTIADSGNAGILNGTYYYAVTYYTANGETDSSGELSISVTNKQVNITLPISSNPLVIGRKIYRTVANAFDPVIKGLVTTIANNTATLYVDNIADGSLGVDLPRVNNTGGEFFVNGDRVAFANSGTTSFGLNSSLQSTGYANSAFGYGVLTYNTNGYRNTGTGVFALYMNTTGYNNSGFGVHASNNNTTGKDNNSFGFSSNFSTTTGSDNSAFGSFANSSNLTGSYVSAFGNESLQYNTASNVSAFGYGAGKRNITGTGNSFFGTRSGEFATTANNNTISGDGAGKNVTINGSNSIYGFQSAYNGVSALGNNNTFFGSFSGHNAIGSGNVFFGNGSGFFETGSNKFFIDNTSRSNESDARATALMYGQFDSSTDNQFVNINGKLNVLGLSKFNTRLQFNNVNQFIGDGSMSTSNVNDFGIRNDSGKVFLAAGGATPQFTLNTDGSVILTGNISATNYTGGATLTGTPAAPTATAGTNTTQIATTAFVQAQASGGNYTPTLTNTTNISSTSLTNATYTRIGDIVTVNIGFSVDPTAANTNTVLTITLPIARTVSTVLNSGSGAIFQSNTRLPANFQTSANTTQGVIYMYPSSTGTYAGSVTFQYNIN